MARSKSKKNSVSVLNWMGTILLCAIPGVNIIALICFLIFAKAPAKRTFAWAMFWWIIILVVLAIVLLLALPQQASQLAEALRQAAQTTTAVVP